MQKIFFIISVDTECDKGPNWGIKHPLSFKNVIEGIPERLEPLFERFHIKTTYLISPEVLMDEGSLRVIQSLAKRAELGTHMHTEFIDPYAHWCAERTDSFQQDFSPQIEFQKICSLTKLFVTKLGFRPTSFRAGRFGLSRYTLRFLEKLGYIVDSSVTPYLWWWKRRGEGVNFLGAAYRPYFPCAKDFRKEGKMRILEVPISIINPFWEKWPDFFLRKINPLKRTQTILLNTFLRNKLRSLWLRPTFSTAQQMLFVTDWIVKRTNRTIPVINMMFHSNEVTAETSPYNNTKKDINNFLNKLRTYFEGIFSNYDVQPIGLSGAINCMEIRRT